MPKFTPRQTGNAQLDRVQREIAAAISTLGAEVVQNSTHIANIVNIAFPGSGANKLGHYLVSTNEPTLPNSLNLATHPTGVLQLTTASGVGTPATLVVALGGIPFGDGTGILTEDTDNLFFDNTNKTLWLGKAGNYNPSTPLRISCVSNVDNSSILFDLADDQGILKTGGGSLFVSVHGGNASVSANDSLGVFAQLVLTPSTTGSAILKAGGQPVFTSDAKQNGIIGKTSIVVSSTDGFAYMNGTTGTPVGTPTRPFGAGTYAYQFDESSNKLWVHNGSAWTSIGAGADALGTYLVASASHKPTNAVDLSTLGANGFLKVSITGGVASFAVDTSTYLTTSAAASTYETQSHAASTYLTISTAASTYETQSHASSTYQPILTAGTGISIVGTTISATGSAGITALTGDVTASGSGSVTATIAKISSLTTAGFVKTSASGVLSVDANTYLTPTAAASTYQPLGTYLVASNNLSDVASASTARTNLGLGALATLSSITLTGDVTGSGSSSFATTIANSAVTLAKMANLPADTLMGNNTIAPAAPAALSVTQVWAMLGTLPPGNFPTLTGDVSTPGGSLTATITASAVTTSKISVNAVTYSKIQTQADQTILGNVSGFTAVPAALTATQISTFLSLATTYQPILSLTSTDVLFATGATSVGQDGTFKFNSTTHTLTASVLNLAGTNGDSINGALVFTRAGDQAIEKSGGVLYLATTDAHPLTFITNGSSRASWDSSGNLVFSSNTPSVQLGGNNGDSVGTALLLNQAHDQAITKTGGNLYLGTTDAHDLSFITNNAIVASFDTTGILTLNNKVVPNGADLLDIGSAAAPWQNVYSDFVIGGIYGLNLEAGPSGSVNVTGTNVSLGGTNVSIGGASGTLGFFGGALVSRQTGGAATAGGTYTSTEQGMLQKAYAALRAYGLLT